MRISSKAPPAGCRSSLASAPVFPPRRRRPACVPWFRSWLEDSTRRAGFPNISADRRRDYLASILEVTSAPQGHSPLRRDLSQPLWLLFAATGVLLGLACLNVAGLFLARGSARGREIGTRLALGASRGRIGRQLLADSLLLSVAGGVLGVAVAPLAIRGLIAFLPHELAANDLRETLSLRLLTFAFFVSIAAGFLSGLAPALRAGGDNVVNSLRERGGTGFGGVRLRKTIVTLQVAFSLILVVGAALFLRTLTGLLAKGPGFDTSSLLSFAIAPLENGYSRVDASRLVRRLDEQVRALPVVELFSHCPICRPHRRPLEQQSDPADRSPLRDRWFRQFQRRQSRFLRHPRRPPSRRPRFRPERHPSRRRDRSPLRHRE